MNVDTITSNDIASKAGGFTAQKANTNNLSNIKSPVSITELCKELSVKELIFSDNQEILLTAVASYIFYESCESDHTVSSVVKVLKTIDYTNCNSDNSVFDCLFRCLRERAALHPAFAYYASFALLSVQEKIELRDSCILLLNKYCDL